MDGRSVDGRSVDAGGGADTPLLRERRVSSDRAGRQFGCADDRYRPDRAAFSIVDSRRGRQLTAVSRSAAAAGNGQALPSRTPAASSAVSDRTSSSEPPAALTRADPTITASA
ncbi:hypothetical protein GCM10023147_31720 [Tsukamurella soli]|uniref:Uncharacterized protein n=1 Tax=Tsukamurella soli TaxID=644556 RepID=A0ABP8JVU3_9ACTN